MKKALEPILVSSKCIKKYEGNPILSTKDVPYEAQLVFNAGVTKWKGQYVMVFRDDYGWVKGNGYHTCVLGLAHSDDGKKWKVQKEPFLTVEDMNGYELINDKITKVYDPRLTIIDGRCYMCFAVDTPHGICGGIGVTDDFKSLEVLSISVPENRNMVLFPEKINGKYVRLERPFPVYSNRGVDKFDLWMSESPDLKYWGNAKLVLAVEDVPYSNDKIGPAAPPVKTEKGWLTTFHAVDRDDTRGQNGWEDLWTKRYTAGIMLLDLNDPSKIIAMSKEPLIAPEEPYETEEGSRNDVIFPGGMILEDDGEVKIYYGSADTVECLATANVDDLIALCDSER